MKTSESILKIAPALIKAQKAIGSAKKDSVNPFFKSKYADLGSVMEACKESLNENGIMVLQPTVVQDGIGYVETVLLHESGEWMSSLMKITAKTENNPQEQGSAITYARRYSLQSMMFIPAEDDDGEKATDHTPTKAQSGSGSGWQPAKQVPLDEAERKFNQSLSSPMYGQTNGEPPF